MDTQTFPLYRITLAENECSCIRGKVQEIENLSHMGPSNFRLVG